ncbi:MAG: nucleotidyl transferase AbiEii/AbiGii toxin family protein [bacterium]|nr:nucleotidyl transferase AbiEii/AbiGii toxin family protein [bacterium]
MIDRQEIMDFSREFGLTPNVIEKDYVLGWVLDGISNHPEIGSNWVFKGGTCLKKCYFETYRFSEDLDFTIANSDHLNQEFLIKAFQEVVGWIYDMTGIEISKETIRFEVYENPRGNISVQGRISYRGPMKSGGSLPRIKLDLTNDEILVLNPVNREVHHPYSDRPEEGIHVQCYCFEELFAEKIRALGERLRPRDLYDVVHLYRHDDLRPDRVFVMSTLKQKCEFKKIVVPTMEILERKPERAELETEWRNMLAHQLPALPPFEQFWQELPAIFEWLYHAVKEVTHPPISFIGITVDETWKPPAMAQAWHTSTPLEVIRFAAANRLCVNLAYQNSHRLIEPYSLRRTSDGNLLLYAVKHDTGKVRSYRVDRIQGTEVTKLTFSPRYLVEMTVSCPISAPATTRRTSGFGISRLQSTRFPRKYSKGITSNFGTTYIVECPYCRKRFRREKNNTRLTPHKDKYGYPCSGRSGYMVDIKY